MYLMLKTILIYLMKIKYMFFQCSEHSSTSKSCCYLTTPTYTECILSDKKYNEETSIEIGEETKKEFNSVEGMKERPVKIESNPL